MKKIGRSCMNAGCFFLSVDKCRFRQLTVTYIDRYVDRDKHFCNWDSASKGSN